MAAATGASAGRSCGVSWPPPSACREVVAEEVSACAFATGCNLLPGTGCGQLCSAAGVVDRRRRGPHACVGPCTWIPVATPVDRMKAVLLSCGCCCRAGHDLTPSVHVAGGGLQRQRAGGPAVTTVQQPNVVLGKQLRMLLHAAVASCGACTLLLAPGAEQ